MIWTLLASALAGPIPDRTTQLILVGAAGPDDSHAVLRPFRRGGDGWIPAGDPIPARIGASGVAWGLGLHPAQPGLQKVEGDLRSPAGVFLLGPAYRDDSVPPMRIAWPLVLVGPRDLWVEDPRSPFYNQHLVVPADRPLLPWEEAARMELGGAALALKVFVRHNPAPARPGAGSAIFLHGHPEPGEMATAGCTAIERAELSRLLGWLDPAAEPVLVLLTREELLALAGPWGLPQL